MKHFFMPFTGFMTFMSCFMTFMSPQQAPFSAAVDLVEVDVIVIDKTGQPVIDLTAADFEIRERGQPQRIDTIFLVTADPAVRAQPPAAPAPAADAAGAPPVGERFRGDRSSPACSCSSSTCRISRRPGFDRSRDAIRSFLDEGLRPIDLAGIVVNGQMLGNRIASDKKIAPRSVERRRPTEPGTLQRHARVAEDSDRGRGRTHRPQRRKESARPRFSAPAPNVLATARPARASRSRRRSSKRANRLPPSPRATRRSRWTRC